MFERFTTSAREVLLRATREAEQEHVVTEEHLAYALVADLTSPAGRLLAEHDLTRPDLVAAFEAARRRGGLTETDATALRSIGIEVGDIVDNAETTLGRGALAALPHQQNGFFRKVLFGRNHLPFHRDSKRVLKRTLHEAAEMREKHINEAHILLALLKNNQVFAETLDCRGITHHTVRALLSRTG